MGNHGLIKGVDVLSNDLIRFAKESLTLLLVNTAPTGLKCVRVKRLNHQNVDA